LKRGNQQTRSPQNPARLRLGLQQPPASKEDRMNNVLRNYS
jgi:hypothetical protein